MHTDVNHTPKLQLRGISHAFANLHGAPLPVLRDVSLLVNAGEFITLVGGSGSGKTTLLRIIDHLLVPDEGEVLIDDEPISRPGGRISFVFQKDALLPWRRIGANVGYGLELAGMSKEAVRTRVGKYLDLVGLSAFEQYYPHQLSGGMRQRVNLARALAVEPDILLMDEPFAALDAQTREMMQLELLRIWQETGKTVLFVTHQLAEEVFLADCVVALFGRPGAIREVIDIDLPRPREVDTKRLQPFQNYVSRLWHLIESDVRRGFTEEAAKAAIT